jgi:CheY-like chemotaxis protein
MTMPLRILCADDNVHVLAMLASTLRSEGYDVETALDGRHALAKVKSERKAFDLIITDHQMPRLDGLGFLKEARSRGYRGRSFVFASPLSEEDKRCYTDLAVDRIIEKPSRNDLLKAVHQLKASP